MTLANGKSLDRNIKYIGTFTVIDKYLLKIRPTSRSILNENPDTVKKSLVLNTFYLFILYLILNISDNNKTYFFA